jgi:hypothetical protein
MLSTELVGNNERSYEDAPHHHRAIDHPIGDNSAG